MSAELPDRTSEVSWVSFFRAFQRSWTHLPVCAISCLGLLASSGGQSQSLLARATLAPRCRAPISASNVGAVSIAARPLPQGVLRWAVQEGGNVSKPPLESLFERASDFFSSTTPEVERRVKQMVQSALARMDLVTREEFDAQSRVLQHTRERLEALERQLAEVEKAHQEGDAKGADTK